MDQNPETPEPAPVLIDSRRDQERQRLLPNPDQYSDWREWARALIFALED